MKTYRVKAKRWEHGWELHIKGAGVTQSHSLADAEPMVRDYVALKYDKAPDSFAVEITAELDGLEDCIRQLHERAEFLTSERERLTIERRKIAEQLHDMGVTGRDTATVLGVSPQRVSQLLDA